MSTTTSNTTKTTYDIHSDVKYGPLELIEAGRLAAECGQKWWNQSLVTVNDSVVRIGVFEGEFHWHKHDREDEVFFVLEGKFWLDIEGRPSVELGAQQAMMVPKGVMHRTRATERAVVLMIEAATVKPTGD